MLTDAMQSVSYEIATGDDIMPNYEGLRRKCEAVIEKNLSGTELLNINDFRDYVRAIRAENDLVFYKYFPPKDHVFSNLEMDTVTCNNPSKFNDVFEGMVTSLDVEKAEKVRAIIKEISKAVTISCFSEEWDNLLMYAHYADSFKGFCVEYDFSYILQQYPECYFFPVLYQTKPSSLAQMEKLSQDICKHMLAVKNGAISLTKADDIISYFIHKADIWKYEKEWRFIIPITQYRNFFNDESTADCQCLTNFDCVSAVFLAPNIAKVHKTQICDIIARKNSSRLANGRKTITVYQTTVSDDDYTLKRTVNL